MKKTVAIIALILLSLSIYSQKKDSKGKIAKEEKKVTYNFIPMPSYDPSTKLGLTFANMFTYKVNQNDSISPRSMTGLGLQVTTNGSLLLGGGGMLYIDEDRWRINPQIIFGRLHQELDLGFPDLAQARRKFAVFNISALRLVYNRIYLGLGYSYKKVVYEGRDDESEEQMGQVGLLGGEGNHGIKYFITQDKRDNVNYPYNGYYAAVRVEQFLEAEKAPAYMSYVLDYRQFFDVGEKEGKHIFGYKMLSRFLGGNPQEQNYSYYGRTGGDIARGYETGSYIDKNMFNVEAEYRLKTSMLKDRLGFVGFTGIGKVFGEYNVFSDADWLPSVGGGVRFELQEAARMNVRFDVALGREGMMYYFGIMEAF